MVYVPNFKVSLGAGSVVLYIKSCLKLCKTIAELFIDLFDWHIAFENISLNVGIFCLQDADAAEIKVQVCVYAFDMIYLNGKSLVKEPFSRRRELLHESFNMVEGEFVFATAINSADTDDIGEFLEESIKGEMTSLIYWDNRIHWNFVVYRNKMLSSPHFGYIYTCMY